MRIGIAAGSRERCGVGDFARGLAAAYPPDVEVLWIDPPARNTNLQWRWAARAADGLDVVHVHYEYGLFRSVKPYRNHFAAFVEGLEPPVVVTLHGPLPTLAPHWRSGRRDASDLVRDLVYLPFFATWERSLHRGVAHWIVHSVRLCDQMAPAVGARRCTCLSHPVPQVARQWRPQTREELVMVTPGFVKPHKGYHRFVRALGGERSWSWIIAGGAQDRHDEEYVHVLRNELSARRLEDRVRITGYLDRSEVEAAMCEAHLAVFPYTRVFGSGAVSWAIGCGMPVVATDLSEFRAMQSRGAGIELLPAGDADRWAEIVNGLRSNPTRLAELAGANREYAAANGFDSCARMHTEIFARVARGSGA